MCLANLVHKRRISSCPSAAFAAFSKLDDGRNGPLRCTVTVSCVLDGRWPRRLRLGERILSMEAGRNPSLLKAESRLAKATRPGGKFAAVCFASEGPAEQ